QITGATATFKEIDSDIPEDGITVISSGSKKFAESEFLRTGTFNLKRYGLKGDGVTSDSTALQSIIDACHNLGVKSLNLPPNGIYLLSNTIELRGSISINGNNSII